MLITLPKRIPHHDNRDGLVRLVAVAFSRFSRDPETRANSSRLMLLGALHLFASETSAKEAAITVHEALTTLAGREGQ